MRARVVAVIALVSTSIMADANDKRVTTTLALPFQVTASGAASSATVTYALPTPASVVASSVASVMASTAVSHAATQSAPAAPFVIPLIDASTGKTLTPVHVQPELPQAVHTQAAHAQPVPAQPLQTQPVQTQSVQVAASSVAPAAVAPLTTAIGVPPPASSVASSFEVVASKVSSQAFSSVASVAAAKPAAAPKASSAAASMPSYADPQRKARAIPNLATSAIKAPKVTAKHADAFVANFEEYIEKKVAPFVPGVAVVVVSGGQIKYMNAYGVRRAGTREMMTPDTVFRLASLSKPVAATGASLLVNEGKISFDSKVTQLVPEVRFKNNRFGDQLTLRHVLGQSTGFPRHAYTHYIDNGMSYAEAVDRLRYLDFVCPPGKCYEYQNVTYSLAGLMMENRSGTSFEDYVERKLFTPLGMQTASYGLASYNASPNRAAPHIHNGKRWIPTNVTPNWYRVAPAAGVNASIVDMSKFLLGQLGKRPDVLPPAVTTPIQSRVTKNTPAQNYYGVRQGVNNTAYGMGWRVFDYGRYKNFVHHGGHVKGFRTEMVFNRELQIGMVFLTNSESRTARDIIFQFLDMHERAKHGSAPPQPKPAAKKR